MSFSAVYQDIITYFNDWVQFLGLISVTLVLPLIIGVLVRSTPHTRKKKLDVDVDESEPNNIIPKSPPLELESTTIQPSLATIDSDDSLCSTKSTLFNGPVGFRKAPIRSDSKRSNLVDMCFNNLTTFDITHDMSSLLQILLISNNEIRIIEGIKLIAIPNLVHLDISFNMLTSLPEEIGILTHLQKLNVSFNKLAELPDSIGKLEKLEVLDLKGNTLTQLPDSLSNCVLLKSLDISENKLKTVPVGLGNLRKLVDLKVVKNEWQFPFKDLFDEIQIYKKLSSGRFKSKSFKQVKRLDVGNTLSKNDAMTDHDSSPDSPTKPSDSPSSLPKLTRNSNVLDSIAAETSTPTIVIAQDDSILPSSPSKSSTLIPTISSFLGGDFFTLKRPRASSTADANSSSISEDGLKYFLQYLRDLNDITPDGPPLSKSRGAQMICNEFDEENNEENSFDACVLDDINTQPSSNDINLSTADLNAQKEKLIMKRKKIVEEICSTEADYVRNLQAVNDLYVSPLKISDIITSQEHKGLFSNLESILALHRDAILPEFLSSAALEGQCIGAVFAKFNAFIKMYSFYVNNFDHSQTELSKCMKRNKKFKSFCMDAAKDPSHAFLPGLQYFLLMPVQRIPRYRLLLEELLKCTDPSHIDHSNLNIALDEIKKRASEINERKREYEGNEKLLSIQNKIRGTSKDKDPLVQPHRKLLKEGILILDRYCKRVVKQKVAYLKQYVVEKEYAFFLMNDIMIQCKVFSDKATNNIHQFSSHSAYEHLCTFKMTTLKDASVLSLEWIEGNNCIRLSHRDMILYFRGPSVLEMNEWCNLIQSNIE